MRNTNTTCMDSVMLGYRGGSLNVLELNMQLNENNMSFVYAIQIEHNISFMYVYLFNIIDPVCPNVLSHLMPNSIYYFLEEWFVYVNSV